MALEDSTGVYTPWTPQTWFDMLPHLSADEKRRLRLQRSLPERDEDILRVSPGPQNQLPRAGCYDTNMIPTVRHALQHYNARHPGDEFDVVKPLMKDGVRLRDEIWSHINFWARSRKSGKIKRFFAEVHKKPRRCSDPSAPCIVTVETCTVIEEPLAQYKRSCAFCHSYFDILHPMDDSEFVCGSGNEDDWNEQEWLGMRFICRKGEAFPFDQE